jgi:hypothetical protein
MSRIKFDCNCRFFSKTGPWNVPDVLFKKSESFHESEITVDFTVKYKTLPFWKFIGILRDKSGGISVHWSRAWPPSIPRNETDNDLAPHIVIVIRSVPLEIQPLNWNRNTRVWWLWCSRSMHTHGQGASVLWPISGDLYLSTLMGCHPFTAHVPKTKEKSVTATDPTFDNPKIQIFSST